MIPHSNDPDALGLLVLVFAPAVYLFCRLFNAHQMGKFRKKKGDASDSWSPIAPKKAVALVFCFMAVILRIALAARRIF